MSKELIEKTTKRETSKRFFYFGEYPQTIKSDDVTITEEIDARGYFLGSDGAYYERIIATPYQILFLDKEKDVGTPPEVRKFNEPVGDIIHFIDFPNTKFKMRIVPNVDKYLFSNNQIVLPKVEYYFKVEPIKWVVLEENNKIVYAVADQVLDASSFSEKRESGNNNYVPPAQYLTSKIRAWLNVEFLTKAFNKKEVALMKNVNIDYADLGYSVTTKVEADDKVKLITLSDATNVSYGFDREPKHKDSARVRSATDFAIARGAEINAGYYANNCSWWLATRSNVSSYEAVVVGQDGTANNNGYGMFDKFGVVPAINVEILVQESAIEK